MMRAGKLDRRIAIQRSTKATSASGNPALTWTTIATLPAELVTLAADENGTGFGEAQTDAIVFRCRWYPGITTADRLQEDGTTYDIKKLVTLGRRRTLELHCEAVS